jgi:hypothetical protein
MASVEKIIKQLDYGLAGLDKVQREAVLLTQRKKYQRLIQNLDRGRPVKRPHGLDVLDCLILLARINHRLEKC